METRKMKWMFLVSIVMFGIMATSAMATTWNVYEDDPYGQGYGAGAIAAVLKDNEEEIEDGDIILIHQGTYKGHLTDNVWNYPIDPKGKELTFKSENPDNPSLVVINGTYLFTHPDEREEVQFLHGGYFVNGQHCTVEGLTFVCGFENDIPEVAFCTQETFDEATLEVKRNPITIRKCKFIGGNYGGDEVCKQFDTGGIYLEDSGTAEDTTIIEDCTISIDRLGFTNNPPVKIKGNSNVTIINDSSISDNYNHQLESFSVKGIDLYDEANLTIEDCTISGNEHCGICMDGGSNLKVDNCTISGNGSVGIYADAGSTGNVIITGNTIVDGEGISQGLDLRNSGEISITDSTKIKNCNGTGVYIIDSAVNVLIDNCEFTNNIAGGAIRISQCGSAEISNCTIGPDNIAGTGGGIRLDTAGGNIKISNCRIHDNEATVSGGGGIYNDASDYTVITNCEITGNKATYGGGIYFYSADDCSIINCTIANNSVSQVDDVGGVREKNGSMNLINCILWGNYLTGYPTNPHKQIRNSYKDNIHIKNCDIQYSEEEGDYIIYTEDGEKMGINEGGNIIPPADQNPQFVRGYHLGSGSPCIDVGDSSVVDWLYDIDILYGICEHRIINSIVDIGADEVDLLNPIVSGISWWKFDEGEGDVAYDSAGDNNGDVYGASWITEGQIEGALDFDGVNDYVTVGSPAILDDLPLGDMTVCAWIRDEVTSGNQWGTIAGCYAYNYGWSFRTLSNANGERSLYFQAPHSSQWANFQSDYGTIVPNTWQHVAVVWDSSAKTATLYIDGSEPSYQLTDSGTGTYNSDASRNKEIGRIPHVGGIQYFDGKIDDVRIYDSALSEEEVGRLYQQGWGDRAFDPSPARGATTVDPKTDLSWEAGYEAGSHDVYIGIDYEEVENADTSDTTGIYRGRETNSYYDPDPELDIQTTYYWRIDEVYGSIIIKGDVWSFTTWFGPEYGHAGWWEFDEGSGSTADDSSSNGNDGTINGATWTSGQINGALDFDGVNDYVTVGSPTSLDNLPLGDMTVCAWIRDEVTSGNQWGTIAGCYAYNHGWSFRTLSNANGERSLYFQAPLSGQWASFQSDYGTIVSDTWQHVAVVWDASTKTATLYINGDETSYQLTNSGTGTYNSDASRNKEIGRIPHVGGIQYFDGKIDDVRIYNRALAEGEIEELVGVE